MDYATKIAKQAIEENEELFDSFFSEDVDRLEDIIAKAVREGYNLGYGLTVGVAVPALVR